MKTPREILLERHRSASARLDAVRANAIAALPQSKEETRERKWLRHFGLMIWKELFWPCRRAWTGMAALWIALWVINSMSSPDTVTVKTPRSLASTQVQTLQEQRRMLAELIPPPPPKIPPAEPPRRNPPPRSQRRAECFKV